jgi:uncharacterized protein
MTRIDPHLPSLIQRLKPGRSAFEEGRFFEAHELWEEVWRELEGEERRLVQGLIQIAAGLHHRGRGRHAPAARLVAKGLEKLSRCAPALRVALDVEPVAALAARLVTPGPAEP